jgi:hypothetical protein
MVVRILPRKASYILEEPATILKPVWFHVFDFLEPIEGSLRMACLGCKKIINLSDAADAASSNAATCEIPYVPKYEGTEGLTNKRAALLVKC